MHHGEVWWADLAEPVGRRPVLLLSRESSYSVRTSVTVALITRTIRNIPVEVTLGPAEGLPVKCVVNLDEILTIPKDRLTERITILTAARMAEIRQAISFALGLE